MRSLLLLLLLGAAAPDAAPLEVRSPDGRNVVRVALDPEGRATWQVLRDGAEVIAPSVTGLDLDGDKIGYGLHVTGTDRRDADQRYAIPLGRASEGRDHYRELTVHLAEQGADGRRMDLVLRAHDDGVALRTVLPIQPRTAAAIIRGEETEFRFPAGGAARCWGFNVGRFGSSHEGEFDPVDPMRVREHNLFDLPFLCRSGRTSFAIAEADLLDFAGMYLAGRGDSGPGLRVRLSPSVEDLRVAVRTRVGSPITTPWRVVMLADRAGDLIGSTLLTDLSAPSRIADTGWIKPGLSVWDWWNGPSLRGVANAGTNTATAKAFVDFAAANRFPYALIDEGWYAGAGGGGVVRAGADVTRVTEPLDLPEVVRYARQRNVGIWLWANWRALDERMEEALAFYERLGVVGIKVDFMDRDDQWMVNWYGRLLEAAARHRLMVNLHGAYVPRGLTRTWPNFVTQEGVLGAEYNKWSGRITATHNVMLAYTRAMLGPTDYTPGGFRNVAPAAFRARSTLPFVQTSRAHGLGLYVAYLSPVAMVADSPDTYADSPAGLEFLRRVPTIWDETRFLGGEVGEWVAVARRKGSDWYIGVLNNEVPRTVSLPLSGLGQAFAAEQWLDGRGLADVATRRGRLDARRPLRLSLAGSGGAALILRPAD